ncbi:MAG TPA: tRNA (adenine-N(6)-)-methyltransferase [Myxococcales bacterium]|nr:tRNA (adenine-N(6)-)-methyltransferase [Myxococcales bacterium]
MPSPTFQFKQFTIHHDRCAMKVGTDGVLLGAWVDLHGCQRILDVGTGSGLIALMLAQRSEAHIDAIEVDTDAVQQARENVQRSPWPTQVDVLEQSLQDYAQQHSYDLIVSNPPFFQPTQSNTKQQRRTARHQDSLTPAELVQHASQLLRANGQLSAIYPTQEYADFASLAAQHGFVCRRTLHVKGRDYKPVKRVLSQWSLTPDARDSECHEETLIIENHERHDYTPAYRALTRDFYLRF